MDGFPIRMFVRLILLFVAATIVLLLATWPYGHWVGLAVGAAVAAVSRRQASGLAALQRDDGSDDGVGGGLLRERRRSAEGRLRIGIAIAAVCAISVIVQLTR